MTSAQTFLHLLKNDIRRQRWIFHTWVSLGCFFIGIVICLRWATPDTFHLLLNGASGHFANPVTGILLSITFLWMYVAAPLILGVNILSSDPPSGADRFWMTRPVSGKVLFLEKLLLLLFITGFLSVLLYFLMSSDSNNKGFLAIYVILLPLFSVLFAQLTILPRKFISVPCLIVFAFLITQLDKGTITSRINLLISEPIQISALPTILAFVIPFVFLFVGIGNQYITRRKKRTLLFFAFSVLCLIGVAENSSVPLEFLEIKEAIPCKGTIESTGKAISCVYQKRGTKKWKILRSNITCFNVPVSEANCYWSPHATKNPNTQHWGNWIYRDEWFSFTSVSDRDPMITDGRFHNSVYYGMLKKLNEDLKNPNWLTQEEFVKDSFSQKAVFVSDKKETKLPLQIFLKEMKLTRIKETPLKKDNFIVFNSKEILFTKENTNVVYASGQISFERSPRAEPLIRFKEETNGTYKSLISNLPLDYFIIFYNPRLNEARLFTAPSSEEYGNFADIKDVKTISDEWRKDAQIIVYHITDTGRTGFATLENPTTPEK
jgi:hypothetical protein